MPINFNLYNSPNWLTIENRAKVKRRLQIMSQQQNDISDAKVFPEAKLRIGKKIYRINNYKAFER